MLRTEQLAAPSAITAAFAALPGLGVILGARVLGEFGDDPDRCTTAKCRKNHAGTSPLAVASGKKRAVHTAYNELTAWAHRQITDAA